nr:RNA-directed DNA polymerase, eukaryota [Tanacetum cinerariifolium]
MELPNAYKRMLYMDPGDKRSFKSEEDFTGKISKSVFVTNFPEHLTARDLWNVCTAYGKVADVYIPLKKSKIGKKFAFVRFLKVNNMERLIENLCTIWIGRFHLHANPVRFHKEARTWFVQPAKEKVNVGPVKNSFASVLKFNSQVSSPSETTPAIVMDDSCIDNKDLSCTLMGKIKDINALSNIYVILADEGFDNVNVTYLGGFWILIYACSVSSKEKMIKHNNNALAKIVSQWGTLSNVNTNVDPSSSAKKLCVVTKLHTIINDTIKIIVKGRIYWIRVKELEAWSPEFNNEFNKNSSSDEESVEDEEINVSKKGTVSADPFGIYTILKRNNQEDNSKGDDLSFPPGFTLKDANKRTDEEVNASVSKSHSNPHCNKNGVSSGKCGSNRSFNLNAGGSILDVMEGLIEIGLGHPSKKDWIRDLNMKHRVNFATIQETKTEKIDLFTIKALWGNFVYDFAYSPSIGLSGGIFCVLDPNMFSKECVTISDSFVAIRGTWVASSMRLMFVSVYSPQDVSDRKTLWEYITHMINSWDGECVILGDFNEVRTETERFGTIFNDNGANAFNHFISSASLIDLSLKGYSYTWALKSATKMSKLDRFLISEGLLSIYPSLAALCLDRRLSDHRPILLRESIVDYGPTPFRVFHSWFIKDGFDKLIEDTWNNSTFNESNKIAFLRKKFQALKTVLKKWNRDDMHKTTVTRLSVQSRILDLDKLINNGRSNDGIINERTSLLKDLLDLNKRHSLDMAQKAKIQWAIEGDENSKYFHGQNISFISHMFKKILQDQNDDLESEVTYDEIKKAVWDYGTNKSPGPGGFTFEFIRKYWKIIQQDVVNAVKDFFSSSKFPLGSNSLFIALIPKSLEAKMVKDFRPISLIGSFYKIVVKILANRLSMVISDLISKVQTTFIAKHQILDGPFILNELISWCKYHKIKAMIFKADFEKAFDSVR